MRLQLQEIIEANLPLTIQGLTAEKPVLKFLISGLEVKTTTFVKQGSEYMFPEVFEFDIDDSSYYDGVLMLVIEAYDSVNNEHVYIGKGSDILSKLLPPVNVNIPTLFHVTISPVIAGFGGEHPCIVECRGVVIPSGEPPYPRGTSISSDYSTSSIRLSRNLPRSSSSFYSSAATTVAVAPSLSGTSIPLSSRSSINSVHSASFPLNSSSSSVRSASKTSIRATSSSSSTKDYDTLQHGYDDDLAEYKMREADLEKSIQQLQYNLSIANTKNNELIDKYNTLSLTFNALNENYEELKKDMIILNHQSEETALKWSTLTVEYDRLRKELKQKQDDRVVSEQGYIDKYNDLHKDHTILQQRIREVESSYATVDRGTIDKLNEELLSVRGELNSAREEKVKWEQNNSKKYNDLIMKYVKLQETFNQKQIEDATTMISIDKYDDLKNMYLQLAMTNEKKQSDRDLNSAEMAVENDRLKNELRSWKEDKGPKLDQEVVRLKEEVDHLKTLKEDIAALQEAKKELVQYDALKKEHQSLKEDLSKSDEMTKEMVEYEALKKKYAESQKEIEIMRKSNEAMDQQLSQLKIDASKAVEMQKEVSQLKAEKLMSEQTFQSKCSELELAYQLLQSTSIQKYTELHGIYIKLNKEYQHTERELIDVKQELFGLKNASAIQSEFNQSKKDLKSKHVTIKIFDDDTFLPTDKVVDYDTPPKAIIRSTSASPLARSSSIMKTSTTDSTPQIKKSILVNTLYKSVDTTIQKSSSAASSKPSPSISTKSPQIGIADKSSSTSAVGSFKGSGPAVSLKSSSSPSKQSNLSAAKEKSPTSAASPPPLSPSSKSFSSTSATSSGYATTSASTLRAASPLKAAISTSTSSSSKALSTGSSLKSATNSNTAINSSTSTSKASVVVKKR